MEEAQSGVFQTNPLVGYLSLDSADGLSVVPAIFSVEARAVVPALGVAMIVPDDQAASWDGKTWNLNDNDLENDNSEEID